MAADPGGPYWGYEPIRRVLASGLVAIGVLCALFAGVFRYIDTHFHDPGAFVENTVSLADNAEVRERIFEEFRAEIVSIDEGINLDELEAEADAEDGEAADDAEQEDEPADDADDDEEVNTAITEAIVARDEGIEEILLDALDSELYQEVFRDGLLSVQGQLIRSAQLADNELLRDPGAVTFNGRRLYGELIWNELGDDPRTAEITQNEVPDTYGIFPIADRETTLDALWWTVENGPDWRRLTLLGAIASLIGAVVIAERRPSRIIQFGAGIVGLALVAIVSIFVVRAVVPLLASGGDFGGTVTEVYAANIGPLVSILIRLLIVGAVLAAVGAIARLIWPDDWVYGQVSDDRGVRSVRRRKGAPEPEAQPQPQQLRPAAAAAPVIYQPYPQQPYGYAPPGWGQPYPPGYPPGYGYPVGPYGQPGAQVPGGVPYGGQPTVPVLPVQVEPVTGETHVGNGALPTSDAAGIVPRVVADAVPDAHEAPPAPAAAKPIRETVNIADTESASGGVEILNDTPDVDNTTSQGAHDDAFGGDAETMAVPIADFEDADLSETTAAAAAPKTGAKETIVEAAPDSATKAAAEATSSKAGDTSNAASAAKSANKKAAKEAVEDLGDEWASDEEW